VGDRNRRQSGAVAALALSGPVQRGGIDPSSCQVLLHFLFLPYAALPPCLRQTSEAKQKAMLPQAWGENSDWHE
jgi:hypothetical protein